MILEASIQPATKTVFLSHSSKDDDLVPGAIALLHAHDATTYIDDADKSLPSPPNIETAAILRTRISECPRFVLLLSANTRSSRWVPWELGVADGLKGVAKVAVMPINPDSHSDATWVTQEYLGLYPRVIASPTDGTLKVFDPRDSKAWGLSRWLTGRDIV